MFCVLWHKHCPSEPFISEAFLVLWTELEILVIWWTWWAMVWGSSCVLYEIYLMLIQSLIALICNILLFIDIADNSWETLVRNWEDSHFSNALKYFVFETMNSSVFYLKLYILFVVASTFVKCFLPNPWICCYKFLSFEPNLDGLVKM